MSGKRKREGGPTRETRRLAWLFEDLIADTGTNQTKLAKPLEVHPSYVNKWMSGEREGVGAEIIGRACKAFSVDPWYFFDEYAGRRSYREYPSQRALDVRALAEKVNRLERKIEGDEDGSKVRRSPKR